jgi:predicted DNA-binding protein
MPRPEDETKAMTVRLPRSQAEELEILAQVEGQPVAEVVREAIASHLAARLEDEAFQRRLRETMDRNQRVLRRLAKGRGT